MNAPKFLNIPKKTHKISFMCTDDVYSNIIDYCNHNNLTLTEGITEILNVYFGNIELLIDDDKRYVRRI